MQSEEMRKSIKNKTKQLFDINTIKTIPVQGQFDGDT